MLRSLLKSMNLPKIIRNVFRFPFGRRIKKNAGVTTDYRDLEKILGHDFSDKTLLKLALTHKSNINPEKSSWLESNERLEFLGDAVLNCLVTEHIYRTYPEKSEGKLSKIKSLVVSRKILGVLGLEMGIGGFLHLGVSELKAGGRKRRSVLSNTFEALLGAIYLDGGIVPARKFLEHYLFGRIEEFLKDSNNVNYKSKILELSQKDGFGIPKYTVISTWGPDHAKKFRIRVNVGGIPLGEGDGTNKKNAEQQAASNAIIRYDKEVIKSHIKGDT